MAENNQILRASDIRGGYILAHAVRQRKGNSVENSNGTAKFHPGTTKSESHGFQQVKETIRNYGNVDVTPQWARKRLPLNMIVSKMATRKPIREKIEDPLQKFDLSAVRNIKLMPPSWRERKVHKKRLLSAYLHNKRMADQIQAMKTRLNICSQYNPDGLPQKQHYGDLQQLLSKYQTTQTVAEDSQEENFNQLYGHRNKNRISSDIESEDPLPQDFTRLNTLCDKNSKEGTHLIFDPTPSIGQTEEEFIWNPVIVPTASSVKSAIELLEENSHEFSYNNEPLRSPGGCSTSHESSYDSEPVRSLRSPGGCSTSTTSSGLTVAEERVQLTYYTQMRKSPPRSCKNSRCRGYCLSSKSGKNKRICEHSSNWSFNGYGPQLMQYFEEE